MPKQPTPSLSLDKPFGNYQLKELIAVGGMAEIYLARTKGVAGFEKHLALKVIHRDYVDDDRFVQMLVDEAKLTVQLNHPNIAQTFDLGQISNIYFISMEYVAGADFFRILKQLSERGELIPIEAALHVISEACAGLHYAHTKAGVSGQPLRIIHRDVSPQNILVSRHGAVKLVDFGIAKAANASRKTRAGVIKGKLVYMAPEQSWGEQVDPRTDVFSAGIVLYEALTGGSLYTEPNPIKLLNLVRKAEIAPPSSRRADLPGELDALVMKALRPKPSDRYQSALEFRTAIGEQLRRIAPDFSAARLGALVSATLDAKPLPAGAAVSGRRRLSTGLPPHMHREDYAPNPHSVIFAAEDLMGSDEPSGRPPARLLLIEASGAKPHAVGEQFIIGRGGDLRLADGRVSRRHARIVFHEGVYLLEDLKSSNGTFLNDHKIEGIKQLAHGDGIRIGPFEMRFELEPASAADEAPIVSDHDVTADPGPGAREIELSVEDIEPVSAFNRWSPAEIDDQTRPVRSAVLRIQLGNEALVLPIETSLPLEHHLEVGDTRIGGVASTLVRRPDGFWIEPASGRTPVMLNGQVVAHPTQLSGGETLTVGPLTLEFSLEP